jgi:hypothetical protein
MIMRAAAWINWVMLILQKTHAGTITKSNMQAMDCCLQVHNSPPSSMSEIPLYQ